MDLENVARRKSVCEKLTSANCIVRLTTEQRAAELGALLKASAEPKRRQLPPDEREQQRPSSGRARDRERDGERAPLCPTDVRVVFVSASQLLLPGGCFLKPLTCNLQLQLQRRRQLHLQDSCHSSHYGRQQLQFIDKLSQLISQLSAK